MSQQAAFTLIYILSANKIIYKWPHFSKSADFFKNWNKGAT